MHDIVMYCFASFACKGRGDEKMQKKKGISLIVLVITIIVMIILAAAIILSLNNAGIIGNANKAVSETDYKNVQTAAQLVYADMMLSETEKPTMMLKQGEYIKQKLISQGTITAAQATMYRFKNNGEVVKLQTRAEYEAMYKDELTSLDSSYYTVSEEGVFTLKDEAKNVITELVVPYGVKSFSSGIGRNWSMLTKVVMPDTVTECIGAFSGCTNLSEVVVSKNIKKIISSFDSSLWLNNLKTNSEKGLVILEGVLLDGKNAIGEVVIPNTVEYISDWAFSDNLDITSVTIPNTVEEIGQVAFGMNCGWGNSHYSSSKLTEVIFMGEVPKIGDSAFAFRTQLSQESKDKILSRQENENAFLDHCED